jgi:hypothetical protein
MSSPCINAGDFSSIITWALVFGGWWVVHKATLSRERRKEKRETAHQICIDLRAVECLAIDFHTAQNHDSRKATDICQDTERLVLQIQRTPLSELSIPLYRWTHLRRSITLHNVDPSDFSPRPANSELIRDIRNAVTDVIDAIEERREQCWV